MKVRQGQESQEMKITEMVTLALLKLIKYGGHAVLALTTARYC